MKPALAAFWIFVAGICATATSHAGVTIASPQSGEVLPGPDVTICFQAEGINFSPGGCNLHFMLDNEPFQVQFDPSKPHVFHDVKPGTHTVRVYAANHLHEAFPETIDLVTFSVGYATDENRPERGEPLLTYVLPQGQYLGIDAADITLDFIVSGATLERSRWKVAYYVDGRRFLVRDAAPRHITGLAPGYHRVRIELVDDQNNIVPGPFNGVERTIFLSPDEDKIARTREERLCGPATIDSIHGAMTNGMPWVSGESPSAVKARKRAAEKSEEGGDAGKPDFTVRREGTARGRASQQLPKEFNDTRMAPAKEQFIQPNDVESVTMDSEKTQTDSLAPAPDIKAAPNRSSAKSRATSNSDSSTSAPARRRLPENMRPSKADAPATATIHAVSTSSTGTIVEKVKPAKSDAATTVAAKSNGK